MYELLGGLRGLATRITALSGPVADAGASAAPLSAAVLLGPQPTPSSPSSTAVVPQIGTDSTPDSGHETSAPQAALPADSAAMQPQQAPLVGAKPGQGLGVSVTSAPQEDRATGTRPSGRHRASQYRVWVPSAILQLILHAFKAFATRLEGNSAVCILQAVRSAWRSCLAATQTSRRSCSPSLPRCPLIAEQF